MDQDGQKDLFSVNMFCCHIGTSLILTGSGDPELNDGQGHSDNKYQHAGRGSHTHVVMQERVLIQEEAEDLGGISRTTARRGIDFGKQLECADYSDDRTDEKLFLSQRNIDADRAADRAGTIDDCRLDIIHGNILERDDHQHRDISRILPLTHGDDTEDGELFVSEPDLLKVRLSDCFQKSVQHTCGGVVNEIEHQTDGGQRDQGRNEIDISVEAVQLADQLALQDQRDHGAKADLNDQGDDAVVNVVAHHDREGVICKQSAIVIERDELHTG